MKWLICLMVLGTTSGCVYQEEMFVGSGQVPPEEVFSQPLEGLTERQRTDFLRGQGLFRRSWNPSVLGPVFNAVSCGECHARDGRAHPSSAGLLFRLSLPRGEGFHPEPVYGDQLQPRGTLGAPGEGRVDVAWTPIVGSYDDGEPFTLRRPSYTFTELGYGPLSEDLEFSPRLAQQNFGLGLLEAVPESTILALADPDDSNGDGISGRANRVWDVRSQSFALGRFGWKAGQPSLLQQNAAAFQGDLGMTSSLFPTQPCTAFQGECSDGVVSAALEISAQDLDLVTTYVALLAPPPSRLSDSATHQRGEELFEAANCSACHVPVLTTGPNEIAAFNEVEIRAYTDLLLHDMGDGLADNRPEAEANGREWRTPPLWGIGHLEEVNQHQMLLHDGRARGVAEAILWHGGEAAASATAFRAMSREDRVALVAFVEAL